MKFLLVVERSPIVFIRNDLWHGSVSVAAGFFRLNRGELDFHERPPFPLLGRGWPHCWLSIIELLPRLATEATGYRPGAEVVIQRH